MAIAAVDRSLAVIEALVEAPAGLALGDLAARLDAPASAIHRTLSTLAERGYVRQEAATQAYALSLKIAELGFRLLDGRHLPDAAQEVLDRLARDTGEYCRLAVVEDEGLAWIARAQGSSKGLRYDPPMGREVVLYATATGKAWLATLADEDALRIVFAQGFPRPRTAAAAPFGMRVVRTVDGLAQLAATRRRGYAEAIEEGEAGAAAVAATFRADAAHARIAGTVSVAGPVTRMGVAERAAIARRMRVAADELTALWPVRQRQLRGEDASPAKAPRLETRSTAAAEVPK